MTCLKHHGLRRQKQCSWRLCLPRVRSRLADFGVVNNMFKHQGLRLKNNAAGAGASEGEEQVLADFGVESDKFSITD